MRHATPDDLDQLEGLLAELRALPELRERTRGSFSRGRRAFLHFHADEDEFYVDVRLGTAFERVTVTSDEERAEFMSRVRGALRSTV
jgi:hypothetical protein